MLSYETFVLVRDRVRARSLEPITLKGISHPVVPYAVEGRVGEAGQEAHVISEHSAGLDLFIDTRAIDASSAERICRLLEEIVATLKSRPQAAAE